VAEPGCERLVPGVDAGVVLNVFGRHGIRPPERAAEPPAEEGVLLALDQALRQVRHHEEAEVERAAAGWVHERFQPERREQQVHQDQPLHLVRIGAGIGVGDHAADVVADQVNAVEAEAAHQLPDVLGLVRLSITSRGFLRTTGAAQVGHDHRPTARGERRDDLPPRPPGLRPAVQQHDGVA